MYSRVGAGALPALIVTVNCAVAELELLSVTLTVNVDEPAAVGVPNMPPVLGATARHAGRLPLVTLQVYPPLPPVALKVAVYALPTVPPGRELVVIVSPPLPPIVRLKLAVAEFE